MVTVLVIYCLQLNPTMCRTLEIVPFGHETASISECIKGGAIYGATTFRLDHAGWFVKGWQCRENYPLDLSELKARIAP